MINAVKKYSLFFIVAMLVVSSCKKDNNAQAPEQSLEVQTTPEVNSVQLPQPIVSTGLPVQVNITSTMPSKGVKIVVYGINEITGATFWKDSVSNNQSQNKFTIQSVPAGWACMAKVEVSSLSQSTNKWSGTFRFSGK